MEKKTHYVVLASPTIPVQYLADYMEASNQVRRRDCSEVPVQISFSCFFSTKWHEKLYQIIYLTGIPFLAI